jgi:3-oxoadipate enol-lactonase
MPNIEVDGAELYYQESGLKDAPAIVFSHSLFFDHRMFQHQVERFSDEYRVVVYDHRGQGESQAAPLESLDMDTLADDAAALIEALDLAPCHFVGNSMGGFIALRLAARRPDLLRSAVAMGSSAEEEYKKGDFGPLVSHMQEHGTTEVIDSLMYIMFGDSTMQDPEKKRLREEWRDYMLGLPSPIGDAAHGVVYRERVLDELSDATVPVLAIAGEEDHAYEVPLSENIAEASPQGKVVSVSRAGHSLAVEQPEAVNEYLAEHFAAVEAVLR